MLAGLLSLTACGNVSSDAQNDGGTKSSDMSAGGFVSETAIDVAFHCVGSEPFWFAELNGGLLVLQMPGKTGADAISIGGGWSDEVTIDNFVWTSTTGAPRLTVQRRACVAESGKVSDYSTDMSSAIGFDGQAPGCCNLVSSGD